MQDVFAGFKKFHRKSLLTLNDWHFIFINTKIEGREDGFLSKSELGFLKNEISITPKNKNIAVVMHHHPAPVGTPLIDNYILENRESFWSVIKNREVKLVICGHVHGDYSYMFNNVMIEASPATCLQWKKGGA